MVKNLLMITVFIACLMFVSNKLQAETQRSLSISEHLMEATFRIADNKSSGTVFIFGRPIKIQGKSGQIFILVTAEHVLKNMPGDSAKIFMRYRRERGQWERRDISVKIRSQGKPMWIKHPEVDVAVIPLSAPSNVSIAAIPLSFLATDEKLREVGIRTGDEVLCLGYPLGSGSNQIGFPILRSGRIASYPLLPTKETKTFLMDFHVFPGNSGGPVYISDPGPRLIANGIMFGKPAFFILGLVTREIKIPERIQTMDSLEIRTHPLKIAEVIHASLIREAIEMIPIPSNLR